MKPFQRPMFDELVAAYPGEWIEIDGVTVHRTAIVGMQPMCSATLLRQPEPDYPVALFGEGCVVGPLAVVHAGTAFGPGAMIATRAYVREGVRTGARCVIGYGCEVAYDTVLGDDVRMVGSCHLTGRMRVGNRVKFGNGVLTANARSSGGLWSGDERGPTIEDDAEIGTGAYLAPGITIGRAAIVAAMAVVTRDVAPGTTVAGCPARPLVR